MCRARGAQPCISSTRGKPIVVCVGAAARVGVCTHESVYVYARRSICALPLAHTTCSPELSVPELHHSASSVPAIMAPRAKLPTDERVAKLIQTASKLKSKLIVDKLVKVLKGRLGLVPSVIDHLRDLGIDIDDDDNPKASSSKASPAPKRSNNGDFATPPSCKRAATSGSPAPSTFEDDGAAEKILDFIPGSTTRSSPCPPTTCVTSCVS